MPGISGRFAQVSGLCFTYDINAAVGSRVTGAVRQDGNCTGANVDLTDGSTYSLAENDFMANGGDGYPNFSSRAVSREFMDEVVSDYIAANTPITPTIEGRIVCTTTPGPNMCPVVPHNGTRRSATVSTGSLQGRGVTLFFLWVGSRTLAGDSNESRC